MTVFPTLFYTSARKIPFLLYTSILKKVSLCGGASPYSLLQDVPPPHPTPFQDFSSPGRLDFQMITRFLHCTFQAHAFLTSTSLPVVAIQRPLSTSVNKSVQCAGCFWQMYDQDDMCSSFLRAVLICHHYVLVLSWPGIE